MSKPIVFSIVGGSGFRAQAYLRIAQALPEHFKISSLVVRDEIKGRAMEKLWNVATYRSIEELLAEERPDFVVVSVSKEASYNCLLYLAEQGIPILAETPPAIDMDRLLSLHEKLTEKEARIQVAEQYQFHPMHASRLSIIESGRLGNITQATVSISHFYHGVSLIRKMLGVRFEEARIRAMRFQSPIIAGPDRSGPPLEEILVTSTRDIAWIDFGQKLGIYDFTNNQHRSWIRSNHLSVRGARGELFDDRLHVLADYSTPLYLELKRINKGEEENQEGYFLKGIMAGEQWVYQNPFAPARLSDDEIAIATCMQKMASFVKGGPSFYSLSEASQDHYLGMLIEKAIKTGETVLAERQSWTKKKEGNL